MGLSNASKMARNYSSIINQPQGGGMKKAGLIPRTAVPYRSIIAYRRGAKAGCCTQSQMQFTVNPNVQQSRPVGMNVAVGNVYFGIF